MKDLETLTEYVQGRAKLYLQETNTELETFPLSIVDFVIEYAINGCHFPYHFSEENKVADLNRGKNALAMACVDIYSKAGAEGQTSHSENGVSRSYDSSWITFNLFENLPNYARIV